MNRGRKLVLVPTVLIAGFVLAVAIWTRNPGLFILAGLSAGTAAVVWRGGTPR